MKLPAILAAALAALLQTGAIAFIVANRALLIAHGREIVLDVIPVDPRDLLRGDYVRLGCSISRISGAFVKLPEHPYKGMPIFVTLEHQGKAGEETWVPVAASAIRPDVPESDSKIVIRGSLEWWYPHRDRHNNELYQNISLRYGIESYFVPESTGRDLEKLTRQAAVKTVVAVDRNGKAAIKGIIVEGVRHDESLL
jgi:uncharacterized membrane-anchored protein